MKVYHWWPGRTWRGPCPIPEFVEIAERRGSIYMTVAIKGTWTGVAFCRKTDAPSRKLGRSIALGRLSHKENFIPFGWNADDFLT